MPSRSSLPSTSLPSADTPPAPVGQAFLPVPTLRNATAASPGRSSGAPSARPSSAIPGGLLSARNTISPAGRHHQSASSAGCTSILPPAGSSSVGPAAGTSSQKVEKSPRAKASPTPLRNQLGTNRALPASPSPGWKTTASRYDRSPCGDSATRNQSSWSPSHQSSSP